MKAETLGGFFRWILLKELGFFPVLSIYLIQFDNLLCNINKPNMTYPKDLFFNLWPHEPMKFTIDRSEKKKSQCHSQQTYFTIERLTRCTTLKKLLSRQIFIEKFHIVHDVQCNLNIQLYPSGSIRPRDIISGITYVTIRLDFSENKIFFSLYNEYYGNWLN